MGKKSKVNGIIKEIYPEMQISREIYKINDVKEERIKIIKYNFLLEPLKTANMQAYFMRYRYNLYLYSRIHNSFTLCT